MGFGPLPGAPDSSLALVPGPWTHRIVRANGIALHVAELGSGPLVLLVHGFPQFWWAWREQMVALAQAGLRAVAVDLRGYGASDKPPRGYDSPTLAGDLAALVTSLGESDAMIVGSDIGGALACTVAARHPRVVRSVVLVGAAHPLQLRAALRPGAGGEQRRASAYALRTFQLPRRPEHLISRDSRWIRSLYDRWSGPAWRSTPGYDAEVERYAEVMRVHPVSFCAAEHFRWTVRSLLRSDGRHFAESLRPAITAPLMHLHGTLDSCVLPSTALGSGHYVSGDYEWHALEGIGHFPHNEVPETVSAELVRWAGSH